MKLAVAVFVVISHVFCQENSTYFNFSDKVIDTLNNKVTITFPSGEKLVKSLFYPDEHSYLKASIDSIGFDIRTLDTSLYTGKYKFLQEVPVGLVSYTGPLVIGDVNKNGLPELYGHEKDYSQSSSFLPVAYEMDSNGVFKKILQFADSLFDPFGIIDIDNDGNSEMAYVDGIINKKPAQDSLATQYLSSFGHQKNSTIAGPLFGDFDKNGNVDVVYWNGADVFIDEYNSVTQTFDSIYSFRPSTNALGRFTSGDFDQDGKTDIVFGNVRDDVYMIEAQGEHLYQVVWQSKVETYNAYLNFKTNDIDGNGKPEFWIGGDAYFNGLGMTRYTCFETDGNNSYHAVARIDLIGIFSFFAGNCFAKDIDNDGKEELFICLDQHVLIFKFTGSANAHNYSMLFAKRNEMANQNSVYYGATLYDLTGNGKDELVINMDHVIETLGRRDFSRIYSLDIVTKIDREQEVLPSTTELFQNYPNPFNPTTTIRFRIEGHQSGNVSIRIYNILGKEIRELLNKELENGEYKIVWDGKDTHNAVVESGVYFYRVTAGNFSATKKMILMK